jgi:hypothetical protein
LLPAPLAEEEMDGFQLAVEAGIVGEVYRCRFVGHGLVRFRLGYGGGRQAWSTSKRRPAVRRCPLSAT